jgi:4-nitrophenyl phosphatase
VNYIIDLDGTVYRGDALIPHAKDFIEYLNLRDRKYLLLTNCPSNTQRSLVEKLGKMGLNVSEANILTSGQVTASYLVRNNIRTVYLVGGTALEAELRKRGIEVVEDGFDCVVVGYDEDFTYDKMKKASQAIRNGARFICTNGDNVIPYRDTFVPHTGAIAGSIQLASGVMPVIIGKPEWYILDEALRILNCSKEECCIIGDNLETDILFGNKHGVSSYLVLTGVTKKTDLEVSIVKPVRVFEDLCQLMEFDASTVRSCEC